MDKIALGGGCHWCTEAIFQSVLGVKQVEQGYVASVDDNQTFSEAVIVYFEPQQISAKVLIEIHLHTHQSTSNHSMRHKYRSAIYTFSEIQEAEAEEILSTLQSDFDSPLVTQVLSFSAFKLSREQIQNYYYDNPRKPFCKTFINPKLKILLEKFSIYTLQHRLAFLQDEN